MCTVLNVADYFYGLAKTSEKVYLQAITHKKIQKLVYYAQVWYYVFEKKVLFKENLEAWVHGPVAPVLYEKLKKYGYTPITEPISSKEYAFSEKEVSMLSEIWKVYGKFDADYLEMLSHSEEPWQEARARMENVKKDKGIIDIEKAAVFYNKKLETSKKTSKKQDG